MTIEYGIACENGIETGTRAGDASKLCEGVFACENTSSRQGFVPAGNGNGLLPKTENNHEGHTSFMGWSGGWFAGVLKALGTKTVRISAGTNRSDEVCGSAAFCVVDGHCSAVAVLA